MDLPEAGAVELGDQLLDRLSDQRFAVGHHDTRVLVVGVEVLHVVDRDQPHRAADARLDPLQPRVLRGCDGEPAREAIGEPREDGGIVVVDRDRPREPFLQAIDGLWR